MNTFTVHPKPLAGKIQIPPSKSHSQRALLFALKGQGISRLENLLNSPDVLAMRRAIEQLGATCREHGDLLEVTGGFSPPSDIIDAGNSGQILRFIAALTALHPTYTEVTGDVSVRKRRPIKPLLSASSEGYNEGVTSKIVGEEVVFEHFFCLSGLVPFASWKGEEFEIHVLDL